jgi:hypothetical protein
VPQANRPSITLGSLNFATGHVPSRNEHRGHRGPASPSRKMPGIAIASRGGMFGPRPVLSRKIKDDCWVCSRPVYEGETAVSYLGLWVHPDCSRDRPITARRS